MAVRQTATPQLPPELAPLFQYLQTRDAGEPQANPEAGAIDTSSVTGVGEIDTIEWGFTPPTGPLASFGADGFLIAYEDTTTPNPTGAMIKVSAEVRSFQFFWPAGTVRSYAVAAYRETWQGEFRTPFVTAEEWQGVDAGTTPGGGSSDHGGLTGLGDDDHTQYLLLAGRTGATNNPILSLDATGIIYGSAVETFPQMILVPGANSTTTAAGVARAIVFDDPFTPIDIEGASLGMIANFSTYNLDSSSAGFNVFPVAFTATLNLVDTTNDIVGLLFFHSAVWQSADDATLAQLASFVSGPTIGCTGSGKTLTIPVYRGYTDEGTVNSADDAGYLGDTFIDEWSTVYSEPRLSDAGANVNVRRGLFYRSVDIGGNLGGDDSNIGQVVDSIALDIEDQNDPADVDPGNFIVTGLNLTIRSADPTAEMRHLGPASFGANAAPTAGYIIDATGDILCSTIDTGNGKCELAAGTYTPTLTNVTNLTASTSYQWQYLRVGNIVTASGPVDIDPTVAGATALGISLPVASNIGAVEDVSGVAFSPAFAAEGAAILGDAANNRAEMQFIAMLGALANHTMYCTLTYQVI